MENNHQTALVQISSREGYIGPKDEKPNVETFWYEGVRYDLATDKIVEVPLGLAEELKRGGHIKNFTIK